MDPNECVMILSVYGSMKILINLCLYISGFVIDYGSSRHKLMYPLSSVKYVYFSCCGSLDIRTNFSYCHLVSSRFS